MPAINCDQFTKILDDKLIPLNSTISELKKSVIEAMSFLEVVNAKYDELLEMMKSSKDERKALKDENKILQGENKILKATIRSMKVHWNQLRERTMTWSSTLTESAWKSEESLLLLLHLKSKLIILWRMSVNY